MGQMTIRQLDDAALVRLKAKAKAQRVSSEALARQAIHREAAALTLEERVTLARAMLERTRAAMIDGVQQTSGVDLIREDRDNGH